jgi:UDPglucose 6-dehydrogenase
MLQRLVPTDVTFDVASNPEFLREGSAVNDFMRPDRIVIGTDSSQAAAILKDIYRPLYLIETPIVVTDVETAEMVKCASNAFLAVRISFMNEIANLCEQVGADVHVVAKGMGLDKRIGPKFLHPGPGYGGSCFPKDTRALAALGAQHGARQRIVETTIEVNERQQRLTVEKIVRAIEGAPVQQVAVLGLSFKPNTSDVREAPAIYVCAELARRGITIRAFDPVAIPEAERALREHADRIVYAADAYDAVAGTSAVVIMTEWNEFRALDLDRVKDVVASPVLVDTRNVLEPARVREKGFAYYSTGRSAIERAARPRTEPALTPA